MKFQKTNGRKPTAYVIAGSNGAGKTTFAMKFLPLIAEVNFVNADLIARGLSPLDTDAVTVEAGRIFLDRIHELVNRRIDFAFETTIVRQGLFQTMLNIESEAQYEDKE